MPATKTPSKNGTAPVAKAKSDVLLIAEPDLRTITVHIVGVTPLCCDNGKQAHDSLMSDRSGEAKTKKITDPDRSFRASYYLLEDGGYGFPSGGIQRALRDAAVRFTDKKGTVISGAIRLTGAGLLPIKGGSEPRMGADFVRHGGRTSDIAYRAYFDEWAMDVPLIYMADVISEANVATLFSLAGFSIGIGAWRPEKNGTCGQFKVVGITR